MLRTTRISKRDGFTLVELIVVLMILVGLAAILIPAVTDMVARTNSSSSSANITEVVNSIQRYETQYLSYPNNLDSLLTNVDGTALDTLPATLPPLTESVALTTNTVATLAAGGITHVGLHTAGDDTFDVPTRTALTDATTLRGLAPATQVALGLETVAGTAGKYVLLGIGTSADLNGKTNVDAPLYFPKDGSLNPDAVYGRFVAIFQITDGTNALRRVKLVGVIAPTGEGLNTTLSDYFSIASNN